MAANIAEFALAERFVMAAALVELLGRMAAKPAEILSVAEFEMGP